MCLAEAPSSHSVHNNLDVPSLSGKKLGADKKRGKESESEKIASLPQSPEVGGVCVVKSQQLAGRRLGVRGARYVPGGRYILIL